MFYNIYIIVANKGISSLKVINRKGYITHNNKWVYNAYDFHRFLVEENQADSVFREKKLRCSENEKTKNNKRLEPFRNKQS